MSRANSKARYVLIGFTLALSLASADSITGFGGNPASQRQSRTRAQKDLGALISHTGLSPLWKSSLSTTLSPRTVRVPLVPTFRVGYSSSLLAQPNATNFAQEEMDGLLSFLQRMLLGRPRGKLSSYRGCKKYRDAGDCPY